MLAIVASVMATPALAQTYGPEMVTNGNFSTRTAGTNLATGTDLSSWVSSVTYTGSGVDAAENQVSVEVGAVNYRSGQVVQAPFPGQCLAALQR
jgi:hypothetical protein